MEGVEEGLEAIIQVPTLVNHSSRWALPYESQLYVDYGLRVINNKWHEFQGTHSSYMGKQAWHPMVRSSRRIDQLKFTERRPTPQLLQLRMQGKTDLLLFLA